MKPGEVCVPEPPEREPGAQVVIALPNGTVFTYHDVEITAHVAELTYRPRGDETDALRGHGPDVTDHVRFTLQGKAWPRTGDGQIYYWQMPGGPPAEKSGS